ncbi:MAG: hypothetical protein AAFV53_21140 [Myxococcota bacterium]
MNTHDALVQKFRAFGLHFAEQLGEKRPGQFGQLADEFFDLLEQPGGRHLGEVVSSDEAYDVLKPVIQIYFDQDILPRTFPVISIPGARVLHGAAGLAGWAMMFFWFQDHHAGLCMLTTPNHPMVLIRLSHLSSSSSSAGWAVPGIGRALPGEH